MAKGTHKTESPPNGCGIFGVIVGFALLLIISIVIALVIASRIDPNLFAQMLV